eukprot:5395091-Pleurochrysis_carterae.AAC.1
MGILEEDAALHEWVLLNILRAQPGTRVPTLVSQELSLADGCGPNVVGTVLSAPFVDCEVLCTTDG